MLHCASGFGTFNKINDKIGAREARDGEKVLALDGKDYELTPGM